MSEQILESAPKPQPLKNSYDAALERLEAAYAEPAAKVEEPAFTVVDKRNAASQQWSHEKSGVSAENAASGRGEQSHHDYHAERPSGPIDRDSSSKPYEAQPSTPERPAYETMDTDQLIFAYAKAEIAGDTQVSDEIRNVYTTAMEEAYTKPGSPISYEEHMASLSRFDQLADAAIAYEKIKNGIDVNVEAEPKTEQLEEVEITEADRTAFLNGEMVFPQAKFVDNEGSVSFDVLLDDGTVKRIKAEELTFEAEENASDSTSEEASTETEAVEGKEKLSFSERVKATWEKGKRGIKNAFSGAYWGTKWTMIGDRIVNRGTEGMTEEEADKKREKNRRDNMLGLAAVGLVLGTAAVTAGITHLIDSANSVDPSTLPHGGHDYAGHVAGHAHHVAEAAAPAPTPEAPDPRLDVHPGEGGYELFGDVGLDTSKWNQHAQELLNRWPQNFYVRDEGGIGLYDKPLPIDAQTFIKGL